LAIPRARWQEPGRRPYALLRDLFAFRFQIQDSDRAAEARQKLEQGIAGFMSVAGAERAPFIGHLLGFDFSASPHLYGILDNARQLRDAPPLFSAVLRGRDRRSSGAGVPEDIHWADDSSLEVIEYLLRACDQLPVLFVALARPTLFERRPGWSVDPPAHTACGCTRSAKTRAVAWRAKFCAVRRMRPPHRSIWWSAARRVIRSIWRRADQDADRGWRDRRRQRSLARRDLRAWPRRAYRRH
jgi:hypothetical protein